MANEQPNKLQFQCGRCDARLTVKNMLAGRKINCPKCHKKIQVPSTDNGIAKVPEDLAAVSRQETRKNTPATEASATFIGSKAQTPEAPAASASSPAEEKPAPPPSSAPTEDVSAARTRIEEQERQLAKRQAEVERLEGELESERKTQAEETASLRTEIKNITESLQAVRAEADRREKQAPAPAPGNDEALEDARRRIAELERQLAATRRQAQAAAAANRHGDQSAAIPEEDEGEEGPDPDLLIAHLQKSTLRRGLRMSLLAHVAVLMLTSLGFLYWTIRGERPESETSADGETPAAVQAVEPEEQAEAGDRAPDTRPAPPVETEAPPDTVTERPRSSIEEEIESLPEPDEEPEPSDVTLDFDW